MYRLCFLEEGRESSHVKPHNSNYGPEASDNGPEAQHCALTLGQRKRCDTICRFNEASDACLLPDPSAECLNSTPPPLLPALAWPLTALPVREAASYWESRLVSLSSDLSLSDDCSSACTRDHPSPVHIHTTTIPRCSILGGRRDGIEPYGRYRPYDREIHHVSARSLLVPLTPISLLS